MIFRKKYGKKKGGGGDIGEHKFCPVCGKKLEKDDAFCTQCGYSFAARVKKPKKFKTLNLIIVILIIVAGYFLIRYTSGQSIFPTSWQDAISTFIPNR